MLRRTAIVLLVFTTHVQSQSFEVTSVKANHAGGSSSSPQLTKGKLSATNTTVKSMLEIAYEVGDQQITGPAWLDSDRFDLAATSPDGVPDTQIKPMLQSLLKARFGLSAQIETKDLAVYNLVIAKEGLKIRVYDPNGPVEPHPARMPGATSATQGRMTLAEIANFLGRVTGRPVVDKTGLEGRYAIFVQYGDLGNDPGQAPDIFGAVQQQLGLKLEPARAELPFVIIDHIDRTPTEN